MKNKTPFIDSSRYLRSSLAILLTTICFTVPVGAERPVFYLDRSSWDTSNFGNHTGCQMLRELIRQSLIVSAELDRGWIPRDASMGDPAPSQYEGPEFELYCSFLENEAFTYRIGLANQESPLVEERIPSSFYDVTVYQKVLSLAEQQARTLVPPRLNPAGMMQAAQPDSPPVPKGISNMDFISVWQQLRIWEQELLEQGESPERLAAIAQGYSTLGMLNYSLISNLPKASLARGLVYAQRMVSRYPESSLSYYTRAYAWTLAGFNIFAADDLEKAKALGGSKPNWLLVIEAYHAYDFERLKSEISGNGFNAQLAGLLSAFAMHNRELNDPFFESVEAALKQNPENLQLYLLADDMGGISSLHWSTSEAFTAFDVLLRSRIDALEGANMEIRYAVYRLNKARSPSNDGIPIDYPALYTGVMKKERGDLKTPSYAALADMIRNTRYTLAYQRLGFMKYMWGVHTTDAVAEYVPTVAGHPYAPLLEAFADDANIHECAKRTSLVDPCSALNQLLNLDLFKESRPGFADMGYDKAGLMAWNNFDRNAFDRSMYPTEERVKNHNNFHRTLLAADPNHYIGTIFAVLDPEIATEDFIERHRTLIESSPIATCMLGQRYSDEGECEKAKAMFEKSQAIEPTRKATLALAALSLKQGDRDAWLKYMEDSRKFEGVGLENAQANFDIADKLLDEGCWEEALPYAETGAGCYSEWALMQAAWINALTGNRDRGRDYMEASAQRYDNHSGFLINFCRIFDIDPLSEAVLQQLNTRHDQLEKEGAFEQAKAANIDLFRGNSESAAALLKLAEEQSNDPWYGLWSALVYEELGAVQQRDEILKDTLARFPHLPNPSNNRKGLGDFVALYSQINASEQLSDEQAQQVMAFARNYPDEGFNVDAHAFAGELLRLKGRDEEAKELFIEIIAPRNRQRMVEYLPYLGLRKMGIDPIQELRNKYQQRVSPEE